MTHEGNLRFDHLDPRATHPAAQMFAPLRRLFAILCLVGIIGCAIGWITRPQQFYFSYLTAYLWALTLVLGMLFFVMLHHVVDAGWSVVVRRPAEQVLAALPLLALLFIPILIGTLTGQIFDWVHANPHDELLQKKLPYLNLPFFLIRLVIYFAVWILLARLLRSRSIQQDKTGDPKLTFSMRRWSAPGLLLYAITFTFAMFDWGMSLQYHWFSTIFGVYVWAGAVVSSLALLTLIVIALARSPLNGLVSSDRLHDLGKLIFAFSVFWAYIAFSQYFLIWYGNIPEETIWFLHRWKGTTPDQSASWWIVSLLLPIGMFVIPFFLLMSAVLKRNIKMLTAMSLLLLFSHYLDIYWLVAPALHAQGPALSALWLDAAALLTVGGASGFVILRAMSQAALYPVLDPRLQEALMGEHVEEVLGADVE